MRPLAGWTRGGELVLVLAATLAAGAAFAQGLGAAADRARQRREAQHAAAWQVFSPPGGEFRVEFPYAPLKKRELIPGFPTLMETYFAAKDERSYLVRVGQMPAGYSRENPTVKTLDEMRDGLVKDAEGEIEGESPVSLGPLAGRELRIRAKAKDGTAVRLRARAFVSGDRVFLVLAGAKVDDTDTAIAERFFGSFAILR